MASSLRSPAFQVAALAALTWLCGCGPRLGSEAAEAPRAEGPQSEQNQQATPEAPPAAEVADAETAAPGRLPSDILSVPDKAWVFSFEGSAAYDKAKVDCDERNKEDPAARARCITKARDAFTADAMEFTRDDAGNDLWVIYRTRSNKLVQVYSVKIEYGEQAGDTVSIKKLGGEKGQPLLFSGVSEFKVKLGGEYSLELEDEKHGLLSYDARLGFTK